MTDKMTGEEYVQMSFLKSLLLGEGKVQGNA